MPFPRPSSRFVVPAVAAVSLLALTACGSGASDAGAPSETSGAATTAATVTVSTNNGEVQVPASPQRVAALDNTSFQTLQAFGVQPVAAPKQLLPEDLNAWAQNPDIADVGSHREPNLEALNAAEPDVIIGGKRFAQATPELQKIAPVVDVAPETESNDYVGDLKKQTTTLGQIFGQQQKATELNTALDGSVAQADAQTNGQTVFLANHNGGKIDNGAGRMIPLIQPLQLEDAFATPGATANSESVHSDSGLAPETVAQANPDMMIVMDRDAATAEGTGSQPASATVEAQTAWANTDFVENDAIVYLDPQFYVTEGIHAYTDAYNKIAEVLRSP